MNTHTKLLIISALLLIGCRNQDMTPQEETNELPPINNKPIPRFDQFNCFNNGPREPVELSATTYWSKPDLFTYGIITNIEPILLPFRTQYTDQSSKTNTINDCTELNPMILVTLHPYNAHPSTNGNVNILFTSNFFRYSNSEPTTYPNNPSEFTWSDDNISLEIGQVIGGGFLHYQTSTQTYLPYTDLFQIDSYGNYQWSSQATNCFYISREVTSLSPDDFIQKAMEEYEPKTLIDRYYVESDKHTAFCFLDRTE